MMALRKIGLETRGIRMRGGIRIGRIFGIQIILDYSWIFIFLLVTWSLTSSFARAHPEWGAGGNLGLAVAGALLFFGSVLVHELAHSLVAIAQGLPVRNITLFLFGGVANIQREPPSPRAEFLITIVGPIASFLLGVLFTLLGGVAGEVGTIARAPEAVLARLGPLATMLLWLGSVNLILAVFNLIPGFPLDGGRVLRSALWAATGDLQKATRWASWVGQAVAWLFIVGGVAMAFGTRLPFFGTGLVSGLWLIFIGWFLNGAAIQSYHQVMVYDLLEGVPVARLMRERVPTVAPETPVNTLIQEYLLGTDEHAFPVVEGERLAGLVCLEDVRKVPREAWTMTTVRQIMTSAGDLVVTTPEEEVTAALQRLVGRDVSQIPVMQAGRFVGMLRHRDIARWLELRSESAAMRASRP
jgi:Zn-dependent protease/predicted transcriptional regulator